MLAARDERGEQHGPGEDELQGGLDVRCDLRGRCCSAGLAVEAETTQVVVDGGACEVLREQVGGVLGPHDLEDSKVPSPHSLLHPQLPNGKVTHLPDPGALHDAKGSAAVGMQLEKPRDAKVQEQRPQTQSL